LSTIIEKATKQAKTGDRMEKRKHQRVPFQAEAVARGKDLTVSGKIDNLSMKGLFLNAAAADFGTDPLQVTILLSGSSSKLSIELRGRVVRIVDTGMAIEFMDMDLDSFILLKNVVLYNSEDADAILDEYHQSLTR
jgi:hypothetical protein